MTNSLKLILKEYVEGIIKIIGKNVDKIILFGSYARNTQNNVSKLKYCS